MEGLPHYPEPGTVEWAKTLELPSKLHPIKYLGALAAAETAFERPDKGPRRFPIHLTRGALIRHAMVREVALETLSSMEGMRESVEDFNQTLRDITGESGPDLA